MRDSPVANPLQTGLWVVTVQYAVVVKPRIDTHGSINLDSCVAKWKLDNKKTIEVVICLYINEDS